MPTSARRPTRCSRWAVDVPPDTVKAGVRDHIVTLSGTVNWQYQREAAARAVMYMRGVTGVANDIFLTATAPAAGLEAEIKAAMLRNAQLDSRAITVEVTGGEVTLRGTGPDRGPNAVRPSTSRGRPSA